MLLDQIREKAGGGLDKLRLYSAVVTKKDRTLDLCFPRKTHGRTGRTHKRRVRQKRGR